jgi:pyruvate-ferredoxin/flavodoxin oxidoreductase
MRGVYFLQTCVAAPDFQKQMFEGLTAPRPGVISVLCKRNEEEQAAFQSRAERAVRSRAFPMCLYDPDRAHRFGMCFDLSANPAPDTLWTTETLSGQNAQGQPIEVEEPFTFAHFAASEAEFAAEFTDPPAIADHLIPMTDYLGFSRRQRVGKLPFISLVGKDGSIVRKVASPVIALQCSDRLHLWHTLQEISGMDNPHVNTTRAALQNECAAQQQELKKSLQQEMEKDAARREQAAVATAVRKLVVHLTGIDPPNS